MVLYLHLHKQMRKYLLLGLLTVAGAVIVSSCMSVGKSSNSLLSGATQISKEKYNIVYFNPEIHPDISEIKSPSYLAFFSGVSDKISKYQNLKLTRVQTEMNYDEVDTQIIREICLNNNSNLAIVPKIKYFKVGLGKYVFSNQVIVSMKVYDAQGNFLGETSYDTYRKNKKILGNTENSIKLGTEGAMNEVLKVIRYLNRHSEVGSEQSSDGTAVASA